MLLFKKSHKEQSVKKKKVERVSPRKGLRSERRKEERKKDFEETEEQKKDLEEAKKEEKKEEPRKEEAKKTAKVLKKGDDSQSFVGGLVLQMKDEPQSELSDHPKGKKKVTKRSLNAIIKR